MILDIYSRYVVGWMLATRESAALAEKLIADTCAKQGIGRGQLTIHADRGSSMTSKPVAFLLADLGVTQSHRRPHVSNDNPYSEAQFKTLKYRPGFPGRFGSIEAAGPTARSSSPGTTTTTATRASACTPPPTSTTDTPRPSAANEPRPSAAAYAAHPERFVRQPPEPPKIPASSWINPPQHTEATAQ